VALGGGPIVLPLFEGGVEGGGGFINFLPLCRSASHFDVLPPPSTRLLSSEGAGRTEPQEASNGTGAKGRGAAYWAFFDSQVEPPTQHLETVKPRGWSEAQGLRGRYLRIENELKPEIDRLWAEKLRDGSWREWIEE
jgi:hypothetical protein